MDVVKWSGYVLPIKLLLGKTKFTLEHIRRFPTVLSSMTDVSYNLLLNDLVKIRTYDQKKNLLLDYSWEKSDDNDQSEKACRESNV